jgi:hypothetical protein
LYIYICLAALYVESQPFTSIAISTISSKHNPPNITTENPFKAPLYKILTLTHTLNPSKIPPQFQVLSQLQTTPPHMYDIYTSILYCQGKIEYFEIYTIYIKKLIAT